MAVEAGGIGARLRVGREKLGLTVLQVAERIHTDPKIVEALEAEDYEALGAPVYARGHIRHFAELVGESAAELTTLYSDLSKVAQPDLRQIVKALPASDSSKLVAPALLVISVFAVAGAVCGVSALSKKKPQLSETHLVEEEAPSSGSAAPESGPASGSGTARVPVPPPSQTNSESRPVAEPRTTSELRPTPGGSTLGRTASAGSAGPAGRTGTAGPTPGGAAAIPGTPATTSNANAPPRPTDHVQVTLRYSADSWTEVYDASGARLFYDVGAANSVRSVVGTPPLRVVLGNAAGVTVEFNGHGVPITKLANPDGSVQFSISRSGHVIHTKPADGG